MSIFPNNANVRARFDNKGRRPKGLLLSTILARVAIPVIVLGFASSAHATTQTFNTPATSGSYTVPAGVSEVKITARGGAGGHRTSNSTQNGGGGATIGGIFAVNPGDVIHYVVGEAGESGPGDAGGGGSTGVFINNTLVIVAGGGGGYDNTQGTSITPQGLATSTDALPAPSGVGAASDCLEVPGGIGGSGGNGAGFTSTGGSCGTGVNGGSGGGGINSAGGNSGAANTQGVVGGGGSADLTPSDGLTVASGGASTNVGGAGHIGGRGFTGGGGSDGFESGGGGGYSGGAGANSSRNPSGGSSFIANEISGTAIETNGGMARTGDGAVVIEYSTMTLNKVVVNDDGGSASASDFTLRLSSTAGDVTTATAFSDGDVFNLTSNGSSNTYTASEDTNASYTQTGNTCNPITHTLSATGTDYTCTITNDDDLIVADLLTKKTLASGDSTPNVGDTVTFEIEVTNDGPDEATNVTLTDLIPAGLTATANNGNVTAGSYAAGTGGWTIPTLANGASATLTIEGVVAAGQGGQIIVNTLANPATSDQPDPTTTGDDLTESVTVPSEPELTVTKSAGTTSALSASGTFIQEFSIVLTNSGDATISNPVLTDNIEAQFGLAFDPTTGVTSAPILSAVTGSTGVSANAGFDGDTSDNLITGGSMEPGDSLTVTFSILLDTLEIVGDETNMVAANGTPPTGTTLEFVDNDIGTGNGTDDGTAGVTFVPPFAPLVPGGQCSAAEPSIGFDLATSTITDVGNTTGLTLSTTTNYVNLQGGAPNPNGASTFLNGFDQRRGRGQALVTLASPLTVQSDEIRFQTYYYNQAGDSSASFTVDPVLRLFTSDQGNIDITHTLTAAEIITLESGQWIPIEFAVPVTGGEVTITAFRVALESQADGTSNPFDPDDTETFALSISDICAPAAPSLSMTKVADSEGPHTVGDVITYTYTVTNDGAQVIRDVAVTDTHNGSDPAPTPSNETLLTDVAPVGDSTDAATNGSWDTLAPGDTITFTGTYTVTQTDAETL